MGERCYRCFNEDFGFPNSAKLAVQPASLLQGDEATLMVTIGALEAIRTGTMTLVEMSSGISPHAAALAETSSPELLQAVRAFAAKHDLGYTIHLSVVGKFRCRELRDCRLDDRASNGNAAHLASQQPPWA